MNSLFNVCFCSPIDVYSGIKLLSVSVLCWLDIKRKNLEGRSLKAGL